MTELKIGDWRLSASVIGLKRYLDYFNMEYFINEDILKFNEEDITEEKYLIFAEYFFKEFMHHRVIQDIFKGQEISKEQEGLLKEKLGANSVCKKVFKGLKDSGQRESILKAIEDKRTLLIKDTFKSGVRLYKRYCQPGELFKKEQKICRINGYYTNLGTKAKGIGWLQDKKSTTATDNPYMDFIPFAFTKGPTAFFINSNFSIKDLEQAAEAIKGSSNTTKSLFHYTKGSTSFLDYSAQIVTFGIPEGTAKVGLPPDIFWLTATGIDKLKKIGDYYPYLSKLKVTDKIWIDQEQEVVKAIIKGHNVEWIVKQSLKLDRNSESIIRINQILTGGAMEYIERARKAGFIVSTKLEKNKLNSYRNRLITEVAHNRYSAAVATILKLGQQLEMEFNFLYKVLEAPENNVNILYSFINALVKKEKKGEEI